MEQSIVCVKLLYNICKYKGFASRSKTKHCKFNLFRAANIKQAQSVVSAFTISNLRSKFLVFFV